ncbi:YtpR family tRNA-binding protein [Thalassobacillus sp. CUG 92003]|uniref:YtpR family tRNA-binding protein n=1 Tax=Thalassobacillus sp. CUG 92003 TaxID=2736641 RepID=UPI0015E7A8CC|nr:DUF4479 family protein [Thalassobacillus sp. CUG 92003]
MYVYYNPKGVGDVLIFPMEQGERNLIKEETYGDVVKITDTQNGNLLGYNIFNFSHYHVFTEHGRRTLDEDLLNHIQSIFTKNQLDDHLEIDLSPKFVVGYVESVESHENADHLSVCSVNLGEEHVQIVCGAPNIAPDQKVVVAKVGAVMPSGMKIKATQLRGIDSYGMICSAKELQLPDAPQEKGILVLDDSYEIGMPFEI